ncbi:dTDP-glucose 4,6-dehydratase (plasmid) [Streptomyces sp. BB1-1-1]|uniref:dTDP-glucose 4,6-dehydratase n=1 Tax=Streptomyces sp. BB1-1-1 TaxID=3074430 RepID=UPI002877EC95|nr:dTDP-glucose 4,6-dehydratase [Streptomyces sp. BB1-1-1]WND32844.1 dTDP-glucose 4,6-dehydratase [Streptomyces sp. BB1-1-1]WND40088.1 dTDP-glucose 4,6-dehydratase [Streptomyces sp. BB1-1-1]WND40922.1 dTDP-glucose 4,6-dehydratase [Streptomyces sp. BB1-1-1]
MHIVVTGGAGFIGSHFVKHVLGGAYPAFRAARVTVLDKFTYAGSGTNLSDVTDHPLLTIEKGDICDGPLVDRLLADSDLVVHFAAESHVDRSIAAADVFVRTNVIGTHRLLEAALKAQLTRFVCISTDEVYGSIGGTGRWDERAPLAPNSPYSASKASSDLLALAYYRTHGLPVCVTRCSNTYGSYQHPEKVIPRFVTQLLQGHRVPLYGDGSHVRDWLHVNDHCQGVALVAADGRPGQVYNIGGGTELTNRDLTQHILALFGADWSRVDNVPDRKGHDLRYALTTDRISGELGYRPAVPFEDGLARTVAWYTRHPEWWKPLRAVDTYQGVARLREAQEPLPPP